MTDMAGALLVIVAADVLQIEDTAFVAQAMYAATDREIAGNFFVVPSRALIEILAVKGSMAS